MSAELIAELWSDEGCSWHIEHRPSFGSSDPWTVILEWATDRAHQHDADWAVYTWEFYGATVDEAVKEAFGWCNELAPWRPCGECDGRGQWRGSLCVDCNGTGLAA